MGDLELGLKGQAIDTMEKEIEELVEEDRALYLKLQDMESVRYQLTIDKDMVLRKRDVLQEDIKCLWKSINILEGG